MVLVTSIAQFESRVKTYIAEGDFNKALYSIHYLVDQIFCEPINTAQIFGSKLLDDLCQQIGLLNLHKLQKDNLLRQNNYQYADGTENAVVYIVSKLQASGGHTAVLADIIRLAPSKKSVILVTGIGGRTDQASIKHRFSNLPNVSFEYAPRGKHFIKLDWLQQKILALKPSDVWLFNHHQDSISVAAVQPNTGYKLHFYHHGDHHLCLGAHLSYADHVDIHPMGYHQCRNNLQIKDNRYLPMSVKDLGERPSTMQFKSASHLVTCTAAGFNKVEVPYFIQYVDVIPELLRVSGGKHIHIGRLTASALRKIRSGLSQLGVPESAFIYIPFVPSVWKALHEYKVDLYITSFPYGGARTLIEAMGAGIPVAAHNHCTSRLLGTFDMVHKDALIWRDPVELYDFVRNVDTITLKNMSGLSRDKYLEFHREETLKNALAPDAQHLEAPALHENYSPDKLQIAVDISNQVTCIGSLKRSLYRMYRHWQSSRA